MRKYERGGKDNRPFDKREKNKFQREKEVTAKFAKDKKAIEK